jgi:hypothetical protein
MSNYFLKTLFFVLAVSPLSYAHMDTPHDLPTEQEVIEAADYIDSLGFVESDLTYEKAISARDNYSHLDPTNMVPDRLLATALNFYKDNQNRIANKKFIGVVDFSANASKARFFIISMKTGVVKAYHVAHGSGSDRANDGYAESFSNVSGSNASSLGYYLTAETYSGKHGLSLRLDGLSSTNSNVRSRAIVIHGASYVYDKNIKAGRSEGCLAVSNASRTTVVNMMKSGALIYAGR